MGVIKGWLKDTIYKFFVSDGTTSRAMFDEQGYLYQLGTKLTPTAAQMNGTAPVMTTPSSTNPIDTFTIGGHSYASGTTAWTLSAAEALITFHKPTLAGGAVDAIVPTATIRPYCFINASGQAVTVKTVAGSGIAIANAKAAWVMSDATNVIRLTPDA